MNQHTASVAESEPVQTDLSSLLGDQFSARSENPPASPTCEHCQGSFERRRSGGKAQRYCSTACRMAFHGRAQPRKNPSGAEGFSTSQRPNAPTSQRPKPPTLDKAAQKAAADAIVGKYLKEAEERDPPDWKWWQAPENTAAVVLRTQKAVAVYRNDFRDVVIRQEGEGGEDDSCIFLTDDNVQVLIDALCELLGFGGSK